jgi:hypothetical protein
MAMNPHSQCLPLVRFIAALPERSSTGGGEHLRFLAFLRRKVVNSPAVSFCVGARHRGQFPQSDNETVNIIKVVEDVNGDAQAFASR